MKEYYECLETISYNDKTWTFSTPKTVKSRDIDGYEYDRIVLIPELMELRRKIIEQVNENPRAIDFEYETGEWLLWSIPELQGGRAILDGALWGQTWEYLGHGQHREVNHVRCDKVKEQAQEIQEWLNNLEKKCQRMSDARAKMLKALTHWEQDCGESFLMKRVCSKCGGEASYGFDEPEADGCPEDWAVTSRSWDVCLEGCGEMNKRFHIHSSGGTY